jgi:hypothetical protein
VYLGWIASISPSSDIRLSLICISLPKGGSSRRLLNPGLRALGRPRGRPRIAARLGAGIGGMKLGRPKGPSDFLILFQIDLRAGGAVLGSL